MHDGLLACGALLTTWCKAAPEDDCPARERYVAGRLKARKNSAIETFKTIIAGDTKVLILGEMHGTPYSAYTDWLKLLKKEYPQLDCIFLESDQGEDQPVLDQFQAAMNPKSWEDSINKTGLRVIAPKSFAEAARDARPTIRLYAIDFDPKNRGGNRVDRNVFMADRIRALAATCSLAFFVVGEGHMEWIKPHFPTKSIWQNLQDARYTQFKRAKVQTHHIAFRQDENDRTFVNPDHCKYEFDESKYRKEFSFVVSSPGDIVRVYNNIGGKEYPMLWNVWDSYIKVDRDAR